MDTPPPPNLAAHKKRLPVTKTAVTPFRQSVSNNLLREFKTECQPKVSSRFVQDRANKSNHEPVNNLYARLGSIVKPSAKQITGITASSSTSVDRQVDSGIATLAQFTPGPATALPPALSLKSRLLAVKQNANVISQAPPQSVQNPITATKQEPPSLARLNAQLHTGQRKQEYHQQHEVKEPERPKPLLALHTPYTPKHLPVTGEQQPVQPLRPHLIQDTRVGSSNHPGPIATATKAPFSVSQYTQPTPSSNKSAHHVSRAQSEPSIKYQVKVNDKTYKILRKIGSGGSAKVYEGFEPNTYQSVAIKIINVANADPRTRESYFNEKLILSQLKDSKHVVRIYNSEYKSECKELVIVMEKGDADLSQVLDHNFKSRDQTGVVDGIFIKFYWRGMLLAVNEIHHHGIVHSDLKPVNFILVKNQIKLIDFGIACSIDPEGTSIIRDYQIGTINYMAPESLRNRALESSFIAQQSHNSINSSAHHNQHANYHDENDRRLPKTPRSKKTVIKYNSKADIWSLGCILYNFVYGRPPFDKYPDIISKVQAITSPRHAIDFPEINNAHLLDCLKQCLRYNPEERPSAEELLNHEYLRDDIVIVRHKQQH